MTKTMTGAPLGGMQRVNRRGDAFRGVLASLLMLAIAIGVPGALVLVFGNPLPDVPQAHSLMNSLASSDFILHVIVCIVWLAWAQFTACLLAEFVAGVRGSGLPRRVPLAGAQQDVARRLVTAVLLLATASQGLHSAPHPTGGRATATVVSSQAGHLAGPSVGGSHGPSDRAEQTAPSRGEQSQHAPSASSHRQVHRSVTREYVVMPPDGRHHDSLWDIADRYLGSGIRYKEIFQLNEGRLQPDGERLTLESLIRPGWTLILPADAHGEGLIEVTNGPGPHATVTLPAPASRADTQHPTGAHHTGSTAQGGAQAGGVHAGSGGGAASSGGAASGGADQGTARTGQVPVISTPVQSSGRHASPETSGAEAAPAERAPDVPWDLVGAELLAAGVLEALIAMRRRRSRGRRAGGPVAAIDPDGAAAEVGIRLGADRESAAFLDHALRTLAAGLGEYDRPVPEIFAARLTEQRLELQLAVPAREAPAPFLAEDDGAVWVLPRNITLPPVSDAVAPLPGLVSVGGDGSGRVFVDLEAAGGPISVAGDLNAARSVVAAAAIELVTNRWSDDMRVTLVGFGSALAPISPERLRCVASLDEVIEELTDRLSDAASMLGNSGLDSVLTGRVRGGRGTPYPPEFVVLASPPAPDQLATLQAWAATSRRAPLGVLVAGEVPGARWQFSIGNDGILDTGVLGLTVGAQQLSARSYAGVARLLQAEAAATRLATAPPPPPAAPVSGQWQPPRQPEPVVPSIPRPVDPAAARVLVRIFGEPTVECEELRPATPLAAEIVTYVALVGEVSPRRLASAIWPYGVTLAERDAAVARAAEWLGNAGDGQPRLRETEGGRLRLADDVVLDWHQFVTLASRGNDQDTLAALELVRGPLAEPHQPRRYTWLAREAVSRELPAYVVDVAHRLAESYLAAGRFDGAAAASRAGLRAEPDSAVLWDDLAAAVERRDGPGAVQLVWAERSAALEATSLPDTAQLSA